MTTRQPEWQCVAQLGDRNPVEHGGLWVFTDATAVYPPEAEKLFAPEDDNGEWTAYRFILEPCTFQNGVLSDNRFHPDEPAWFQDDMGSMCNCMGIPLAEFVDMICNGNAESRARAWEMIGDYHGFENLDSYPLTMKRAEVEARYAESRYATK